MKTHWAILFLLVVTTAAAQETPLATTAAEPERISLWDNAAPIGNDANEQDASEEADAWITVHQPAAPNGTAAVICPGGGYGRLVVGPEGHGVAKWLNRHGITGVVLEYRLPAGRHAVPLLDAQRAIRTVRSNAKQWKLDPTRIGIIGFSAGGHLASTAATHFDMGDESAKDAVNRISCRPDFAILIYPVVTMIGNGHSGSKTNLLGPDPSPELMKLYSNELQVTPKTPPMFMAHAVNDSAVPPENSRLLSSALQENGIKTKYLELPTGGHGLSGYKGPMWDAWQSQSLAWLTEILNTTE